MQRCKWEPPVLESSVVSDDPIAGAALMRNRLQPTFGPNPPVLGGRSVLARAPNYGAPAVVATAVDQKVND
jgi:hypothetical protein